MRVVSTGNSSAEEEGKVVIADTFQFALYVARFYNGSTT